MAAMSETAHLVQMFDSTVVLAHVSAAGQKGANNQALGRSRGGFSTKIHLKTDFGELPIAFHLTGGEASDSRNFETLLDISPDINPRAAHGDKGYDSKSNREAARRRGICPAIPYRSNTKDIPVFLPLRGRTYPERPAPFGPGVNRANRSASFSGVGAARRPAATT